MSIVSVPLGSIFVARYQAGLTPGGGPITRQKTFTNVKPTASDEDIYEVAATLFNLLEYPLLDVRRDNRFALENE
ncbi:MAG: DUF1659 domain-containing protein [Desulfitobacteriia bacterium]|jgi:hypothetical protein